MAQGGCGLTCDMRGAGLCVMEADGERKEVQLPTEPTAWNFCLIGGEAGTVATLAQASDGAGASLAEAQGAMRRVSSGEYDPLPVDMQLEASASWLNAKQALAAKLNVHAVVDQWSNAEVHMVSEGELAAGREVYRGIFSDEPLQSAEVTDTEL